MDGSFGPGFFGSLDLSYGVNGSLFVLMGDPSSYVVRTYDASYSLVDINSMQGSPFDPLGLESHLAANRPDGEFVFVWNGFYPEEGVHAEIWRPDSTPPSVASGSYQFETFPTIELQMKERVRSIYASIRLTNLGTGEISYLPQLSPPSFSYEPSKTVSFAAFPALLDGNYRAQASVWSWDLANNYAEALFNFDFFILAGDANHDRNIDVADFKALTSNWMQTNRTFSQGDFNYDGTVNQADLDILSAKWNTTLPAYVDPVPTKAPAPTPISSKKTRTITSLVLT
jgi:hypothetical protein